MEWEAAQMHILLAKRALQLEDWGDIEHRLKYVERYLENINPAYIGTKAQDLISHPEDRKLNDALRKE